MTEETYQFYQLPEAILNEYDFDALPFPVRADRAGPIFETDKVSLDAILDELDQFLFSHPELKEKYAGNAAKLAMLCATNNVSNNDTLAALGNLNAGMRISPQHRGLRVHQALALQLNGYTDAAAIEYEQLLWDAPQAFDPLIRSLAAKAFIVLRQYEKAFEILDFLPEKAFQDETLFKLRESIVEKLRVDKQSNPTTETDSIPECQSCGEPLDAKHQFCPSCGAAVEHSKNIRGNFCSQCGSKIKPGNAFCTNCGQSSE
ncbi:zinc ribbon domain-containing protein [Sedimenticola selenatireducens]|uniref:Zinc ribbon domain-containing protein n=1 Tax=Sedimenticola selenatireducens TaxID=191960 RepID=A0A558DVJ3_9GAMM|nr:zinc ribbon domain-containing protein [Sedimenticola selenatireducens]TVO77742.1 zinc ribbon domain-containing protein [Sedimenticola selenatireducens]TVT65047.1 MAG: zinc ribbon domain-containing protein [Sedimenticola selenatireducens]